MGKILEKTSKKIIFESKDGEKTLKLMVKLPDNAEAKELQKVYDRAFREAFETGAIYNAEVEKMARKLGIWNDAKTEEVNEITKQMRDIEFGLAQGANSGWKKSEAKDKALEMVELRSKLRDVLSATDSMYADTCEARATNARFNHLVLLCSKDAETNKKLFKNQEHYEENGNKEWVIDCITFMGFLDRGLDPEYWQSLPETKFLKKYGYINDKGLFQNKDGKLVNKKGEPVDEDGRRIDENGNLIDVDGRIISKDGDYVVDFKEFED